MNPSDRIPPKFPEIELQNLGKEEPVKANVDFSEPFVATLPPTLNRPRPTYKQVANRLKEYVIGLPVKLLLIISMGINYVFSPFHSSYLKIRKHFLEKEVKLLEKLIDKHPIIPLDSIKGQGFSKELIIYAQLVHSYHCKLDELSDITGQQKEFTDLQQHASDLNRIDNPDIR